MKKTAFVLSLCLLCFALTAAAVFYPADKVVADEIKIYPDDTSQYAAYGNAIAYTTNKNELVLSTENGSYTLSNAYAGKSRSIAMNGDYVFLISVVQGESAETVSFTAYPYSLDPVSVAQGTPALRLFDNVTSEEIAGNKFLVNEDTSGNFTMGGYDLVHISGDFIYCMSRSDELYPDGERTDDCLFWGDLSTKQWNKTYVTMKNFATSTDFVIVDDTVYFNTDGKLYSSDMNPRNPVNLQQSGLKINSLAYANGIIYALSDDGIYAINTAGYAYKKLTGDTFDGKIRILQGDGVTYLLAQDVANKSIKQYVCEGTFDNATLTYYNVFDGVIYKNPESYDLLKVGKVSAGTDAYYSPKNLKIEFSLDAGDYVLALAKQDGFYYVRNDEGKTAYIRESELSLLDASESTAIGKYAQALHDGTDVYKYPYVSDDVVATVNIDVMLIVVDNVAQDGDNHVWGWYKVCIVGDDGTLTYGYMQAEYVSKYTNFKLPSFSTDATVSAGSLGGIINVYLLPDEESEILGTLTDGDKITLAQEKLDGDSEWTKIVYKDMVGYVKTANLISKGITPLQITLIVVFAVVIVATAIVIFLVVKKRNAQKFDY